MRGKNVQNAVLPTSGGGPEGVRRGSAGGGPYRCWRVWRGFAAQKGGGRRASIPVRGSVTGGTIFHRGLAVKRRHHRCGRTCRPLLPVKVRRKLDPPLCQTIAHAPQPSEPLIALIDPFPPPPLPLRYPRRGMLLR
eukprot:379611-Prorocentrum_minimum.AAC.1